MLLSHASSPFAVAIGASAPGLGLWMAGRLIPHPWASQETPLHRGRRYEAILLGPTFVGDGLCLKPWGGGTPHHDRPAYSL